MSRPCLLIGCLPQKLKWVSGIKGRYVLNALHFSKTYPYIQVNHILRVKVVEGFNKLCNNPRRIFLASSRFLCQEVEQFFVFKPQYIGKKVVKLAYLIRCDDVVNSRQLCLLVSSFHHFQKLPYVKKDILFLTWAFVVCFVNGVFDVVNPFTAKGFPTDE